MKYRTLPKHIMHFRDGFRVQIQRGDLRYTAVARDIARAVELRDKFLRIAGLPFKLANPRSNTGHVGISETATYRRERRFDCFLVSYSKRSTRICFTPETRSAALQRAVAKRREMERSNGGRGEHRTLNIEHPTSK